MSPFRPRVLYTIREYLSVIYTTTVDNHSFITISQILETPVKSSFEFSTTSMSCNNFQELSCQLHENTIVICTTLLIVKY